MAIAVASPVAELRLAQNLPSQSAAVAAPQMFGSIGLLPPAAAALRSQRLMHVTLASVLGASLLSRRRRGHHWIGLGRLLRSGAGGAALCSGSRRTIVSAAATAGNEDEALETLPSWDTLNDSMNATQIGKQLQKHEELKQQGRVPHTDVKIRRFSDETSKPRVTLYRDSAAWCPYCQKVWLLLEEKRIDFQVEKINMRSYGDKPQAFLDKVPRGLLPAIEIDGRFMTESLDIMFTIERVFADKERPMYPTDGPEREKGRQFLELERAVFYAWCKYLFSPSLPFLDNSASEFEAALQQVDDELASSNTPWFLSYDHPTIVDMQYVSHMERMVASALYWKGLDIRAKYPKIDRWLKAFEELPYYMASKSDYYTHVMDIPPQYGTPFPDNNNATVSDAKLMIDPKTTMMPIKWQVDMEQWTEAQKRLEEREIRLEAAFKLMQNREAVARFCARAAGSDVGKWGFANPTRSGLADPYAMPNEDVITVVDAALRTVAIAMFEGNTKIARDVQRLVKQDVGVSACDWKEVAKCIEYLRDRVGVPRDMSMPAAKIFRAFLGEAVRSLKR